MSPFVRWTAVVALALVAAFLAVATMMNHGDTRVAAYSFAMVADLRRLAAAEADHFAKRGAFADSLNALDDGSGHPWKATAGVIIRIDRADERGWQATASHVAMADRCTVSVNAPPPPASAYDTLGRECRRTR